eukprot:TRINITY_DN6224_c0_g1_i1.p1 TRINITY_DN6224_c0_g1~~TRINITY_DN6224_c0_g1_i1.p1  ORF type:complete len:114 (-),score=16.30 TRINITY_DN6224_c0_g1_i1:113-454(-)
MIGMKEDRPCLLLETQPRYKWLAELFLQVANTLKVPLTPKICLHAWGSDHISYMNENIPALLTTFDNCTRYFGHHSSKDTTENISPQIGASVIKVIAAVVALVALKGYELPFL